MTANKVTIKNKYFVTKKVACPECKGTGVLSLMYTCLICDGSGFIKNDVPLKDALNETIKELEQEKKKHRKNG